jgi:hypothetical protein
MSNKKVLFVSCNNPGPTQNDPLKKVNFCAMRGLPQKKRNFVLKKKKTFFCSFQN